MFALNTKQQRQKQAVRGFGHLEGFMENVNNSVRLDGGQDTSIFMGFRLMFQDVFPLKNTSETAV